MSGHLAGSRNDLTGVYVLPALRLSGLIWSQSLSAQLVRGRVGLSSAREGPPPKVDLQTASWERLYPILGHINDSPDELRLEDSARDAGFLCQ